MLHKVLGLDIGGANLKAGHTDGTARLVPFALWKEPHMLGDELRRLIASMPDYDSLAVTMTGELCDCYESKRQGVHAILNAVEAAVPGASMQVWRNDGRFVDIAIARETPLQIAAANWLALATFAGRFAPEGPALLIDIGSTTTDIVPLHNGIPIPSGRTDPERLRCGELVYTGVRRTPVCSLLGTGGAAELFATTLDVYLILDSIAEDAADSNTADGRPATKAAANARLARMLCADLETSTADERRSLALRVLLKQTFHIASALESVAKRMPRLPDCIVVAGSGEFLLPAILNSQKSFTSVRVIPLGGEIGATPARAACAYAVAALCAEQAYAAVQ
jgi:probable H4MPT-linked C1 transfer pathway protein